MIAQDIFSFLPLLLQGGLLADLYSNTSCRRRDSASHQVQALVDASAVAIGLNPTLLFPFRPQQYKIVNVSLNWIQSLFQQTMPLVQKCGHCIQVTSPYERVQTDASFVVLSAILCLFLSLFISSSLAGLLADSYSNTLDSASRQVQALADASAVAIGLNPTLLFFPFQQRQYKIVHVRLNWIQSLFSRRCH